MKCITSEIIGNQAQLVVRYPSIERYSGLMLCYDLASKNIKFLNNVTVLRDIDSEGKRYWCFKPDEFRDRFKTKQDFLDFFADAKDLHLWNVSLFEGEKNSYISGACSSDIVELICKNKLVDPMSLLLLEEV